MPKRIRSAIPPGGPPAKIREQARGSACARGYGRHHEKWRLLVLHRDPTCRIQKLCGRGVAPDRFPAPSTVADHKIPLRSRWKHLNIQQRADVTAYFTVPRFLEMDPEDALGHYLWSEHNGQGACKACHDWKTRQDNPRSN